MKVTQSIPNVYYTALAVTYISTTGITTLAFLLIVRILIAALLYAGTMKIFHAKVMNECIAFIRKKRLS